MKNYRKLPYRDCCYYCNWFRQETLIDICVHPSLKFKDQNEVEVDGICDYFDDEIRGN
jgi:hypothetical protein